MLTISFILLSPSGKHSFLVVYGLYIVIGYLPLMMSVSESFFDLFYTAGVLLGMGTLLFHHIIYTHPLMDECELECDETDER